jgi:hypothetical protein
LQHSHPPLFSQKLEAERINEKEERKRKSAQQNLDFVKRPKIALGSDILFEEETVEPSSSTAVIRPFPIFGKYYRYFLKYFNS